MHGRFQGILTKRCGQWKAVEWGWKTERAGVFLSLYIYDGLFYWMKKTFLFLLNSFVTDELYPLDKTVTRVHVIN